MNKNKYAVVLHVHFEAVGTERVPPFEYYPNCTDVENDGSILCFTDDKGEWRKTSAPWTITKMTEPKP